MIHSVATAPAVLDANARSKLHLPSYLPTCSRSAYLKGDGIPPLVRVVFENVLAKCLDSNRRYFMNMKILGSVNQSI